jgi:ABC-type oligopeptide transport system ATPase subunit
LDTKTRRLHAALIGQTGTGKSTLLQNLMRADLESGRGFVLIDPHGDLAQYVANATPLNRINDIVYFDPLDPTHAVGFNPLDAQTDHAVLTANIVSSFKHIWRDSWGPRMEYILGNAIRLLLSSPGETLVSLPLLLVSYEYREKLLEKCTDPVIKLFWTVEYAGYSEKLRSEAIAPIQNKIGQFTSNPMIRAIIGQQSTVDIPHIINSNKILVANLSKSMGEEPSHLLGAFLVTAIAQAAQSRSTIPEEKRLDFTLYVDEFQNFATETFASILSEMRKWRLNLVVANQFMGQVPDILRQSILGNVGTIAVFRIGAEDAPMLADQLDFPNPRVLSSTKNYRAWVKTTIDGSPTEPQLVYMEKSQEQGNSLKAVIANTRARYSRKRVDVERSIAQLFPMAGKPEKKKSKRKKLKKGWQNGAA